MKAYNVGVKVRAPVEKWKYYTIVVADIEELFKRLSTIFEDKDTTKISIEKVEDY